MSVPLDQVMRALRNYPDGVSTRDLASHLGLRPSNLASRPCKQVLYGRGTIERDERRTIMPSGVGYNYFVWRAI